MGPCVSILVLLAFCAGCVAMPRQPDGTVLRSLRTLAVVPVKEVETVFKSAPPPATPGVGQSVGDYLLRGLGGTPVGLAVVFVATPFIIGKAIADTAAATDEPRTFEPAQSGPPQLTLDLAHATVAKLHSTGVHQAQLASGHLRIAGVTAGFTNPIKRWYAEDVTTVDYAAAGLGRFDGVLEVATLLWADPEARGVLTVFTRLVDPRTRQVLGRARHWTFNVTNPGVIKNLFIPPFFFSKASQEEFDQAVKARGDELLTACIEDLGLSSK